MAHIIDRRLNDKGRSTTNRKKFIERIKEYAKAGVEEAIGDINIADISKGTKQIRIPIRNLDEPTFGHVQGTGVNDLIVTGNNKYVVGDKIPRPPEGDGDGGGGSDSGEGDDEFSFTLTKEEFLDIFYETCELPFMTKKTLASFEEEIQRTGFRNDGPAASLNIVRSARKATGRRAGAKAGKKKKIIELEHQLKILQEQLLLANVESEKTQIINNINDITFKLEDIKKRLKKIPYIDPIDLQFNAWSKVPIPSIQAVMFCILDVSASMDEHKKQLAKTFFMLLYLFLQKNYQRVVIEFIRHHTKAELVSEKDFFYAKETGGTIISCALELLVKRIHEAYDLSSWGVYVAQGTDGDNFPDDMEKTKQILTNDVLPIVQYYAYAQIDDSDKSMSPSYYKDHYDMWKMMGELSAKFPNLGVGLITGQNQVYPIFKKLFEKKQSKQHA